MWLIKLCPGIFDSVFVVMISAGSLENKPAMPYSVWEEKLRGKLRHWYRCLSDHHLDVNKVCWSD